MPLIKRILPLLVVLLMLAVSAPVTQAQTKLEDVFKKTLDELFNKNSSNQNNDNNNSANPTDERIPSTRDEITLTFAPLVRDVAPSVVNVYAARKIVQRSPFAGDPFFERFFGGGPGSPFGQPRERIQSSLGSGVIVSSTGTILTNHHVIEGADEVKIALSDGTEYEADIVLKDEKSDLAVLQIKGKQTFPALEIGNSDDVEVGDLVLAIGNPFGVGQTVTSGIVSAVARSRVGINDFGFFIQTDAAINPGNSGGALIDMKGRLIGINTAIYSRSGGSNGIGFAIPSNMAAVVVRSATSGDATVARPWLGAEFQDVTPDIAESLGMRRPGGVLVASVFKNGPAERAGLRSGDVVVGINKKIIENADALEYRLDTIGIGGEAELVVIAGGERKLVKLQLEEPPETAPRDETLMAPDTVLGGAKIANLSPAVAQQLGLPASDQGVVVVDVDRQSRAAQNGVQKADIVLAINDKKMVRVADVVAIANRPNRGGWQVILKRGNRQIIFERNGRMFRQYVR